MGLNASKIEYEGKKFEAPDPLEAGTYPARVCQVVDLGLQPQDPYKGEPKDPAPRLRVTYELVDEFMKDEEGNDIEDKPRWQAEDFPLHSLSSDMAKSTKRYLAIDPLQEEGGNWAKLVGLPCMVTLTAKEGKGKHEGRIFNNVASVQAARSKEAEKMPQLANEGVVFDLDDPDVDLFKSFPQFIQDEITGGLNFGGSILEKKLGEAPEKTVKKKSEETTKDVEGSEKTNDEEDW